jgi:hypothetical protein
MPLPHRHDYAAGIHRGLPTGDIEPVQEFPAVLARARGSPARIRQVRAGGVD